MFHDTKIRKKTSMNFICKMYKNGENVIRGRRSPQFWIKAYRNREFDNQNMQVFNIGQSSNENRNKLQLPMKIGPESPTDGLVTKIRSQLHQYFERSTLHGLRYVGDSSISLGERIFWFFSFFCAIAFASYFITILYTKWYETPVIISFSPIDTHIEEIPFPAITICNMNQARKREAEEILQNGSDADKKLLDDYCNSNNSFMKDADDSQSTKWENVFRFVLKVSQPCSEMLKACFWMHKLVDCNAIFNSELTDEGLCCTFNALPKDYIFRNPKDLAMLNITYPPLVYDWNPEYGYVQDVPLEAVPWRPLGAGSHLGLTLILDSQLDHYYCSSTSSVGFKVLLSNPIETPKMADFGFFISPGIETRTVVKPVISAATKTLKSIDVKKRNCYFAYERHLQFYRTYTRRNCKLECQANYTLDICKCVPYFLPKNFTTKICGKNQEQCSNDVKASMEIVTKNGSSCNCLPGCFELNYDKSASYAKIIGKLRFKDGIIANIPSEYFE